MTADQLQDLIEGHDEELLSHVICGEVENLLSVQGPRAVNDSQIFVLCVEKFFGEICNGGFCQFIDYQSGIARRGPEALERVGLSSYAPLLREALSRCTCSQVETDFHSTEDLFEYSIENVEVDLFEDLNARFFELYFADKTEFRRKLFDFIVQNESGFIGRDDA